MAAFMETIKQAQAIMRSSIDRETKLLGQRLNRTVLVIPAIEDKSGIMVPATQQLVELVKQLEEDRVEYVLSLHLTDTDKIYAMPKSNLMPFGPQSLTDRLVGGDR